MKYLLDTHIWYWLLVDPARLKADVAACLRRSDNELLLSAVSVWELLVLVRKGRIRVAGGADDWVRAAIARSPVREVPLTSAIAFESERLSLPHWDPADRFIAATAVVADALLVTSDEKLIGHAFLRVLSNR